MNRAKVVLVGLVLTMQVGLAHAQSVAGVWQWQMLLGGRIPCTGQTVFSPNGSYSEQLSCGGNMTLQTGTYEANGGRIARTLRDYQPKTHYVIDLCPGDSARPGCGHVEPNPAPPAGQFSYRFLRNGSLELTDVVFGGMVVLTRVQ